MDRVELHDVEYGDCTVLVGQNRQILMVDCGSVSRYARRGEEEIDRRFNEIFSRYAPAAQRVYTGEWKDDRYENGILYRHVQNEDKA